MLSLTSVGFPILYSYIRFKSKYLFTFFVQTIENELRKFEIQQANEQVKMLHSFMPESFLRRGGENKCTSTLCLKKNYCLVYGLHSVCVTTTITIMHSGFYMAIQRYEISTTCI